MSMGVDAAIEEVFRAYARAFDAARDPSRVEEAAEAIADVQAAQRALREAVEVERQEALADLDAWRGWAVRLLGPGFDSLVDTAMRAEIERRLVGSPFLVGG